MSGQWRRVGDKASMYLPVLIMGLLALGTWWLVRNAPKPIVSGAEKAVRHDPDYFLKDFVIKNFEASGRLKNRLNGATGEHFPALAITTSGRPWRSRQAFAALQALAMFVTSAP